jgi:hypothetical protein
MTGFFFSSFATPFQTCRRGPQLQIKKGNMRGKKPVKSK